MKYILSTFLFWVGDLVSRPMIRWDLGWLYPLYSKLMGWSLDLDKDGKVWKYVDKVSEI